MEASCVLGEFPGEVLVAGLLELSATPSRGMVYGRAMISAVCNGHREGVRWKGAKQL